MFDAELCQVVKRNLTNSPHSAIAERVLVICLMLNYVKWLKEI